MGDEKEITSKEETIKVIGHIFSKSILLIAQEKAFKEFMERYPTVQYKVSACAKGIENAKIKLGEYLVDLPIELKREYEDIMWEEIQILINKILNKENKND